MAIGLIMEFAGATQAQYDAILKDMNLGGKMPPGGIFHVAGPMDGGWRVVDVWESQAAFDSFRAAQIEPLSRKHGVPAPRVTVFPVHNTLSR